MRIRSILALGVLASVVAGCTSANTDVGIGVTASQTTVLPNSFEADTPLMQSSVFVSSSSVSSSIELSASQLTENTQAESSSAPVGPWPSGLTADEIAAAQASLDAYLGYYRTADGLYADGNAADWQAELTKYVSPELIPQYLDYGSYLQGKNIRQTGNTIVTAEVVSVSPDTVTVSGCVDTRPIDFVDDAGVSSKDAGMNEGPFEQTALAKLDSAGQKWLISEIINPDPPVQC